jgi:outer membrane receptor protein involved in Fe transport
MRTCGPVSRASGSSGSNDSGLVPPRQHPGSRTLSLAPNPFRPATGNCPSVMKTRTQNQLTLALSLAFGLPVTLVAQAAPSAPPLTSEEREVLLETFVINIAKDNGYIAVDSLAGGRTNTPIKLTPAAMSSLTRTFIDDVAIEDIRESLQWGLNVIPSDYNAGKTSSPFGDFDFNFRGAGQSLQGGAGPTRNYFTYYQSGDTYNVERIEFDRGPNSILFGIGTVGGVLSTYTKQARLDKDFVSPQFVFDSNGSARFTVDANRRLLNDKLALRLNLLAERRKGWQDQDIDDQQAADLALNYQVTDRTSVRFDAEISHSKRSFLRATAPEGTGRYDGVSVSNTWGAAATTPAGAAAPAGATARMDGGTYWHVYIPALPGIGINNWNIGQRSNGLFLPIAPEAGWYPTMMTNGTLTIDGSKIAVMPNREFTIAAKDAYSKPEYTTATLWLTHRVTDNLDLALTGYYYSDSRDSQNYEGVGFLALDINKQLPNGQTNPNFGKRYGDFMISAQTQEREVKELRAQLNYKFERQLFGQPYRQTFSVSAGQQDITWRARQFNAQILNAGITGAGNRIIRARIYEDNTHPSIALPSTIGTASVAYASHDSNWFDFDEDYTLKNVAAFTHLRAFDDRLSVLVGARRDTYDQYRLNAIIPTTTASDASGTTYSGGAVYYFGPVGVFANFAKNYEPLGPGRNPSLTGEPLKVTEGEGIDTGLRLSTKDGKYYATAIYYDAKSFDRITGTKIGFGGIWNQYFDARGETRDAALGSLTYDDTQSLHVRGYEFEVTASPTKNIRLQASYALPKSEIVDALAGQRAYYAKNFAQWDAAARLTNTAATNLRTALVNAQTTLDNNVAGRTVAGTTKYVANMFVHYTFTDGRLKGFSVGGGVSRTGRQYSTIIRNETYYRAARDNTSLALSYSTKLRNVPTRFALNINNVLDDTDPIVTSYDGSWRDASGRAIANGFSLPSPRTLKFTVGFTY